MSPDYMQPKIKQLLRTGLARCPPGTTPADFVVKLDATVIRLNVSLRLMSAQEKLSVHGFINGGNSAPSTLVEWLVSWPIKEAGGVNRATGRSVVPLIEV